MRKGMKGIHVVFRVFILPFLLLPAVCVIPNCTIQPDNNTQSEIITLTEKSHPNLSYDLPTQIQEKFRLEVKLCEANTFRTACTCRWTSKNKIVCKNQINESTCDAGVSSLTFGLNIMRTHSDVVWQLLENNATPVVVKHSKLQVSYPPEITNISVKGDTINGSYITNERQKVQISCLFTNGNPPVKVSLISETTGQNVSSAQPGDGSLQLSLGIIGCHDVWPTIRCEAPGSERNRSVLILVRCLPQLSCECSEVDLTTFLEIGLTFGLKSYTRNIRKCELTRLSPRPATTREVPCDIKGSVPELNLTLHADGASRTWSGGGTWMLHTLSEQGNSNITFTLVNNTSRSTDPKKEENDLLVITACALSLIVFGLAIFLFCIVRAKHRGCGGHERMFMTSEGIDRSSRAAEQETPRDDGTDNEPFGRASASCPCATEPKQICWRQARTPGRKNAEGLIYGELDFSDRTASDVIHGVLPETEYAEINFAAAIQSSSD